MGPIRVELMTPALSERCSNQLSYGPLYTKTSEKKDRHENQIQIQISSYAYTAYTFLLPSVLPKEVIQPHFPVRLPCYDFTPLTSHTLESGPSCELAYLLWVSPARIV